MNGFRFVLRGGLLILILQLLACGNSVDQFADDALGSSLKTISGAGATFPEPLYQIWVSRYNDMQSVVEFRYKGVGSGEGVRRFISEEVDFGASDAAMSDAEIEKVLPGVVLVPMTAGMVVLAYNLPELRGELKLPRDVYVDIFLGKISSWDDPRIKAANPGESLPRKSIQVVTRRDGSGTTFAFTNHLSSVSQQWRNGPGVAKLVDFPGGAMTGQGNEGVAQKIKISQGAIGYIEYGFARRLGLPIAKLENHAGNYVTANADSGRAAIDTASVNMPSNLRLYLPDPVGEQSYPMVSLSWLLLYQQYPDDVKRESIKSFVNWALSQSGQEIADSMGYIPLPDSIVRKTRDMLLTIR